MRRFILLLWLVCLLPAGADYQILNKPGQRVDVNSKLVAGKQNLVVFHADGAPISRRMLGEFKALGERRQDLAVLIVDVNVIGSPVSKQYKITSVPSCRIYDAKGALTMDGSSAYNEAVKWCSSGN